MKHKQKVKLAKKLSGKHKGHFESPQWENRKIAIRNKVLKREARQKELAKLRREKKENNL
ncbi:MAG: hypothetical protein AABY22_13775 [Nanoarchaeota archaeon]